MYVCMYLHNSIEATLSSSHQGTGPPAVAEKDVSLVLDQEHGTGEVTVTRRLHQCRPTIEVRGIHVHLVLTTGRCRETKVTIR